MATTTRNTLRSALNRDLKKTAAQGLGAVVDDSARKIFTARVDGAILEFAHRQPDSAYWTGVKYYGSGTNSRIRIRRTATEVEVPAMAVAAAADVA